MVLVGGNYTTYTQAGKGLSIGNRWLLKMGKGGGIGVPAEKTTRKIGITVIGER